MKFLKWFAFSSIALLILVIIIIMIPVDDTIEVKTTGDEAVNNKIESSLEGYPLAEIDTETDLYAIKLIANEDDNEDTLLKKTAEIKDKLVNLEDIGVLAVIWKPEVDAKQSDDIMRVFINSDDMNDITVENYKDIPEVVFEYVYNE